jgi:Fe-S-cluster formation regulator IscX/YfhJ
MEVEGAIVLMMKIVRVMYDKFENVDNGFVCFLKIREMIIFELK